MVKTELDVDKGYAWMVLAACFVAQFCIVGTMKSYGVLYMELDEHYSVGSGPLAFISSINLGCALGFGPFANYLAVKTSFRATMFAGGVLLGIGYASSCFVERLEYLLLSLGIVAGVGYGLAFAPCATIVSFYFKERRALANGIMFSAGGIGTICFSVLHRFLSDMYSLKPALLIIGGLLLNVCVASCCLRQPTFLEEQKLKEFNLKSSKAKQRHSTLTEYELTKDASEEGGVAKRCSLYCLDFKFKLLMNPRFSLYVVIFMLSVIGLSGNLILIPSHARALGYDKKSVALTVAVMGGFEIFSRIFVGWFADKNCIQVKYIYCFCFLISCISAYITPLFKSLEYMCLYGAIIGTFPASFWTLIPLLTIDVVGMEEFPPAYGIVLLGLAIGVSTSHPSLGWIKDYTGSWEASFYLTGTLFLVSAILLLAEPWIITIISQEELHVNASENGILKSLHKVDDRLRLRALSEDSISFDTRTARTRRLYKAYKPERSEIENIVGPFAPLVIADDI